MTRAGRRVGRGLVSRYPKGHVSGAYPPYCPYPPSNASWIIRY